MGDKWWAEVEIQSPARVQAAVASPEQSDVCRDVATTTNPTINATPKASATATYTHPRTGFAPLAFFSLVFTLETYSKGVGDAA